VDVRGLRATCCDLTGLPPERVRLIFAEELVALARQPRFARAWVEILNMPVTSWPIYRIADAPIFGTEDLQLFAPTYSEYREATVATSKRKRERVMERLVRDGVAVLAGRSASGKTVAAVSLAVEHDLVTGPAY
jgi:hypothetical protein